MTDRIIVDHRNNVWFCPPDRSEDTNAAQARAPEPVVSGAYPHSLTPAAGGAPHSEDELDHARFVLRHTGCIHCWGFLPSPDLLQCGSCAP